MICDIVIPVWNKKELTERCLSSILSNTYFSYRIVLIDNASSEPAASYLKKIAAQYPDRIKLVVNKENIGNTAAGIQGMKYSDAGYVCILDNDTIVCKGWLSEMASIAESSDRIGIVNPNSNSFGLKKPQGVSLEDFTLELLNKNKGRYVEVGSAVGFCYMVKRGLINKIGYWDERFSPGYFEDTEYSMRAKRYGYKSVIALGAYVYHDEHSSFKSGARQKEFETLFRRSREKFYALYGRPRRILCIIDKPLKDTRMLNERVYHHADKGDFIDIVIKEGCEGPRLPHHGNIRKVILSPRFFNQKVWLKRITKKKRYEIIWRY